MNNDKPIVNSSEQKLQKTKKLKNTFLVTTILFFLATLVLLVLFVLSLTGLINIPAFQITSQSSSIESKAYDTPEEVIDQFVLAIQSNDFESALELFAVNNMVEGYDFEAYVERINAFMPINSMAPQEYEAYSAINQTYQSNIASNQIKMFTYSLLIPELDLTSMTFLQDIEDDNIDLLDELDPSQLGSLELVRADFSSPELQRSDNYQDSVDKSARIYGFGDQEEYVALFEFEGDYYLGGFVLVEYEEGWQISGLGAPLAGVSFLGVEQITESEYLEIISD